MKITEFELYVMFVGCCSECSPAELRVQTALCAGRCAGLGWVRCGAEWADNTADMLHVAAPLIHTPATLHLGVFVS